MAETMEGPKRLVAFSITGQGSSGGVYVDSAPVGVTLSAAGYVPNWRWSARTVEFSEADEAFAWAAWLAGWGACPV